MVQTQALLTVLFAAVIIGDRPTRQQIAGLTTALLGWLDRTHIVHRGHCHRISRFSLASAMSWAIGNVLVKRLPKVDMFRLIVWASSGSASSGHGDL